MSERRFVPGVRVTRSDGRTGTVCHDLPPPLDCNGPGEVSVRYDDEEGVHGTDTAELTITGFENAVPDPVGCGAGRGGECCIFLTAGASGFCCERHTAMRWPLIFRREQMSAQRIPLAAYPSCMAYAPSNPNEQDGDR